MHLKKHLYLVYLLCTTLLLLEIAVRLWGYADHYLYDPIYEPFPESDEIPFVHKPNLENVRARGLSIINTDSLGLRAMAVGTQYGPKQPNEYRIAIMGDSVTFGQGVLDTNDTYAQVLETTLNQQQDEVAVRVFNFGVSAYSVQTMVATLRHRALAIEPDFVIMAVTPQDFALTRTGVVDAQGYNISTSADKANIVGNSIKRLLQQIHLTYLIRDIMIYLSHRGNSPEAQMVWELPATYDYVLAFKAVAEENDIPYLIVVLPMQQPHRFHTLPEQLAKDKLAFIDLLTSSSNLPPEQFQASPFDKHPSAAVHHQIGQALADHFLAVPYFPK